MRVYSGVYCVCVWGCKMRNNIFKVCDTFETLQGEGSYAGRYSLFIRLSGCNLKCSFCDEPKHKSSKGVIFEGDDWKLLKFLVERHPNFFDWQRTDVRTVVVTGGEPTLYNVNEILATLNREQAYLKKFEFCVESNGLDPFSARAAHLYTLSPKDDEYKDPKAYMKSDWFLSRINAGFKTDIKLLCDGTEESIEPYITAFKIFVYELLPERVKHMQFKRDFIPRIWNLVSLYISPINGQKSLNEDTNKKVVDGLINGKFECLKSFDICPVYLNTQMHKVWNID